MGIRSYFKNTVKSNVNVKGWASWGAIKDGGKVVTDLAKDLGGNNTGEVKQRNFADVVSQYGLTEKDLQTRMKSCLAVSIVCAILGLCAFGWMILLLTKSMYLSSIVSLALSVLMFSYSFSQHFYYFEIKQRRLGCTFREWLSSFFSKG